MWLSVEATTFPLLFTATVMLLTRAVWIAVSAVAFPVFPAAGFKFSLATTWFCCSTSGSHPLGVQAAAPPCPPLPPLPFLSRADRSSALYRAWIKKPKQNWKCKQKPPLTAGLTGSPVKIVRTMLGMNFRIKEYSQIVKRNSNWSSGSVPLPVCLKIDWLILWIFWLENSNAQSPQIHGVDEIFSFDYGWAVAQVKDAKVASNRFVQRVEWTSGHIVRPDLVFYCKCDVTWYGKYNWPHCKKKP